MLVGCGSDTTSGSAAHSTATGAGGAGGGGATSTSTSTGSGGPSMLCPAAGMAILEIPACASAAAKAITVPKGCEPAIDGVFHDGEWSDGACFNSQRGISW